MKVGELRKMVVDAGGSLKIDGLDFEKEDGPHDLDIKNNGTLAGWIRGSEDNEADAAQSICTTGKLSDIDSMVKVAIFFGISVGDVSTVTVEKKVNVVNDDHLILKGKVEAYEKIIIGRAITASA